MLPVVMAVLLAPVMVVAVPALLATGRLLALAQRVRLAVHRVEVVCR